MKLNELGVSVAIAVTVASAVVVAVAAAVAGGAFLKAFVREDIPWVHFDVAGTSYHVENRSYAQKDGASGQVIRLVLDLLGV